MSAPRVELDQGRIALGDAVFVYLERTLARARALRRDEASQSYGLAPTAIVAPHAALAAIFPGEAIWLGFQAVDPQHPALLRVRLEGAPALDAITGEHWDDGLADAPRNHLVCPPGYRLAGLPDPAGDVPFGPGELTVIVSEPLAVEVSIRIADPDEFAAATGQRAEPLDPSHGYGGWRLP